MLQAVYDESKLTRSNRLANLQRREKVRVRENSRYPIRSLLVIEEMIVSLAQSARVGMKIQFGFELF